MKLTFRLLTGFLLAAICAVLHGASTAEIEAEMKRIEVLTRSLEQNGIAGMLAAAMPAPVIHSQYLADKIGKERPEERDLEQAKRIYGLKLARALDDLAEQLQKNADARERTDQATRLLDLAEWLKKAPGYGNYMLFSRSESLSTIPLVYLTADLNNALTVIATLRSRITPAATEHDFRVRVLNDEAPQPFIDPLPGNGPDQDDRLEAAWNRKWREMAAWFRARNIPNSRWQRDALPEALAFFLDDEVVPEPFTTVNLWNFKRHNTLVFGHRDVRVRSLDEFMLYREKVGSFPTQPPAWWKPHPQNRSDTALRAAFKAASDHLRRENGQPFGYEGPSLIFQQLIDGEFLDRETQLRRQAAAEKPATNQEPKSK